MDAAIAALLRSSPGVFPSLCKSLDAWAERGVNEDVIWYILKVRGSYYDIQEDRMCREYAETLQNDGYMPTYLKSPVLRRIVAYEHIRVLLAQSFNRFSWTVDLPAAVQDFNSSRLRRMGQFFTTMAQILMASPRCLQEDEPSLAYFVSDIARRFVDQDNDEDNDVYRPPTLEWIMGQLGDLKGNRDKEDQEMADLETGEV
ncbi:uncharacterized protein PG998_002899 [Apiospora kogelbergensis]|uniref:uncharacterized protein n=1 Tax=Apiospora kogelbergensis TaxID=1337665 RepID=UPI0031319FDB